MGSWAWFSCTWETVFEVVILPKFLLFLVSHVFSVVLWFKAFYKQNLACFFVLGFSDGECMCLLTHTCMCVHDCGRDTGWSKCCGPLDVSLVHTCRQDLFCFWFQVSLFSSHCMLSLSWENLGKGSTCPGYLISLEKHLMVIQPGRGESFSQNWHQIKSGEENLF